MKLVKESIEFQRGGSAKETLRVGTAFRNKDIKYFLDQVEKFEELDLTHDQYTGWTEIHEGDLKYDPRLESGFKFFVEDWKDWLSYMENDLDLYLVWNPPEGWQVPTMEATMFVRED